MQLILYLYSFKRVFYFPLKTKLKALLNVPFYRSMLEHESTRDTGRGDDDTMSDVYDAPIWKEFMGEPKSPCDRIGKYLTFLIVYRLITLPNPCCRIAGVWRWHTCILVRQKSFFGTLRIHQLVITTSSSFEARQHLIVDADSRLVERWAS